MAKTKTPPTREEIIELYAAEGATAAAEAAGVSKRTVQRWAAKADVHSGYENPILRPCPSAASYQRGCRCEGCVEANREVQREIKARRVAKLRAGRAVIKHGVSGYSNWDCRCAKCRSAWSKYLRDRRLANQAG